MFSAYSEIDGDEELPLGEEFQHHINSFIKADERNPIEKYKMSEKIIKQLLYVHSSVLITLLW